MKKDAFEKYLIQQNISSINNYVSRISTVEKHHGCIDTHYDQDKCQSLLALFSYGWNDVYEQSKPLHDIPISPKSKKSLHESFREGTSDYASRIKKYVQFRNATQYSK